MVSMFNWVSTQTRLETMKAAEAALMSFANRYGGDGGGNNPTTNKNSTNEMPPIPTHNSETHTLELFDTEIPRSVVPLKDPSCQMLNCNSSSDGNTTGESSLIMHGIKVVSKKDSEASSSNSNAPLVLLHGYANGALYFYRNLLGLSNTQSFGGTVYALDLLGWGLSSRPQFKLQSADGKKKKDDDGVETAEQFFVESLEAWRKAHNLDKMTLGGHSMGGYLSVAYCEKYPQHVDRLILLSPAGIPEDDGSFEKMRKDLPLRVRFMIGMATTLWNCGVTPSSFVRAFPESRGRKMVASYVEGRLPSITCPDEQKNLTEYLYTNAALPPSGEDCLSKILKPLAFAKRPLIERIPHIKVQNVSFVYGQQDWMTPSAGIDVQKRCEEMRNEGNVEVPKVEVYGVQKAGHLLMLENPIDFNNAVIAASGGELSKFAPKPFSFFYTDRLHEDFFQRQAFRRRQNQDETDANSSPSVST